MGTTSRGKYKMEIAGRTKGAFGNKRPKLIKKEKENGKSDN